MNIQPFAVSVPQQDIDSLRTRLGHTRWPDEAENAGWAYGASLAFMREVARYWSDDFDWRAQEQFINTFANFRAEVDGVGIHYVHERGKGSNPLPLLITHGWPSSFYEMLPLVRLLTDPGNHGGDPADAFDVVVPSVPGYAFSDRQTTRGFNYRQVADLWVKLMEGLGYPRFAAHSYDIGGSIMGMLLRNHPGRVIGNHTTEPGNPTPYLGPGSPSLTDAERDYVAFQEHWQAEEGGYMALQTTRPQTLGYGLNDSPVGLAAWIIEKWHAWTDPPVGDLTHSFTMDQLLTNVSIYWFTQTINSANRLYYERAHHPAPLRPDETINVPLGVSLTNEAIDSPPREYVERVFPDIRRWESFNRGGHFIALEEPERLAEALREFFRPLRQIINSA